MEEKALPQKGPGNEVGINWLSNRRLLDRINALHRPRVFYHTSSSSTYIHPFPGSPSLVSKMAYVSRRFASQLSTGQRVFNAFREWYVSACGYRQLGKYFKILLTQKSCRKGYDLVTF